MQDAKQGSTPGAGTPMGMAREQAILDLDGWDAIGKMFDRSGKWASRMTHRFGMPVRKIGGRVRASSTELNAWSLRFGPNGLPSDGSAPQETTPVPALRLVGANR